MREKKSKLKKTDEDLIRQQIKLSGMLFEATPAIAKKAIAAANLELERLESIQAKANEKFKVALSDMKDGFSTTAKHLFEEAAILRQETGEEQEEALAREKQAECYLQLNNYYLSRSMVEEAQKIYAKIGDHAGIARIEAMIKNIDQVEKDNENK